MGSEGVSLTLWPVLRAFVLLLGFYVQPRYFGLCLVLPYFFLCGVQLISFEGTLFSQMKQRESGSMGKKKRVGGSSGEMEGEETLFGMFFIREE